MTDETTDREAKITFFGIVDGLRISFVLLFALQRRACFVGMMEHGNSENQRSQLAPKLKYRRPIELSAN